MHIALEEEQIFHAVWYPRRTTLSAQIRENLHKRALRRRKVILRALAVLYKQRHFPLQ